MKNEISKLESKTENEIAGKDSEKQFLESIQNKIKNFFTEFEENQKKESYTPEQKVIIAEEYALLQQKFTENPKSVDQSLLPVEYSKKVPKDISFRNPDKSGTFTGEIGNSQFIPNSLRVKEHLAEYGLTGIEYKNDEPDFGIIASKQKIYSFQIDTTVEINHMTGQRHNLSLDDGTKRTDAHDKDDCSLGNFEKADNALAEKLSQLCKNNGIEIIFTGKDIQLYRENNHLMWHECQDMAHMQLIPTDIHSACPHTGGTALSKYLQKYGNYDYEQNNTSNFQKQEERSLQSKFPSIAEKAAVIITAVDSIIDPFNNYVDANISSPNIQVIQSSYLTQSYDDINISVNDMLFEKGYTIRKEKGTIEIIGDIIKTVGSDEDEALQSLKEIKQKNEEENDIATAESNSVHNSSDDNMSKKDKNQKL